MAAPQEGGAHEGGAPIRRRPRRTGAEAARTTRGLRCVRGGRRWGRYPVPAAAAAAADNDAAAADDDGNVIVEIIVPARTAVVAAATKRRAPPSPLSDGEENWTSRIHDVFPLMRSIQGRCTAGENRVVLDDGRARR